MANYVYIFECAFCYQFYGEQTLNDKGELLCPLCESEQRKDSIFVERMKTN